MSDTASLAQRFGSIRQENSVFDTAARTPNLPRRHIRDGEACRKDSVHSVRQDKKSRYEDVHA
jgi:hypothetical protein